MACTDRMTNRPDSRLNATVIYISFSAIQPVVWRERERWIPKQSVDECPGAIVPWADGLGGNGAVGRGVR